ncbi:endonuclease [Flavobacterium sp.]|uniref:endonuclease n=1 Tax=Flavobacterium sp. TaxID=239 RepID=UPI00261DF450|nr:endonuclease [Flavobacterium sp.]
MIKKILLVVAFLFAATSYAQIVINELDCDTPSTDDKEFIELKSATPFFALDGYVLVLYNGTGSQINLSYYVIDLDGFATDINGIFVVGNQLVSPVPDKFLPESIFQNGPDGVALYLGSSSDFPNNTLATATNLVSAIVYGTNDPDATSLMSILGVTTQLNESSGVGGSTVNSIQRKNDGTYESKTPTPGANNDGSGFIYNGITIAVSTNSTTEVGTFNVTFTTQTNVTSDLNFSFTLDNGSFITADFTGNTSVFIPTGSNSFVTTITLVNDALDEGDELAKVKFGTLPAQYNRLNDEIEVRIIDNDFYTLPFGTPLNPTFGNVSSTAPAGYYATLEGLAGAALKQGLQDIIANPNMVRAHSYGDITDILKTADQNPLNSNQVWLMYKEVPKAKFDFQTSSNNAGKWNREHIYPQSRGGFTDGTSELADGINVWLPTNANDILAGHADAHHIRAEDGPENSIRNNKDYGLTGYNGPSGNQNSWKGDVARSVFYMAIRYNQLSVVNGDIADTTVGQLGDLATLLNWNTLDPRDDFEMNRNNYIYTWQVNRNPFIDYPNLADYIWGGNTGQQWFSTLSNASFEDSQVLLYPNPSKGFVTISGIEQEYTIEVYNNVGSKIVDSKFTGTSQILTNWASGIYIAKITSDSKTIIKKIVVQ